MSLEDEAADWGRQEEERDTASRFRSYRAGEQRRTMDEAERQRDQDNDAEGFTPIRIEGAKRISKLLWRITDKVATKISKRLKLTAAEMAELVDDTAPVVQLYVPDPGTAGSPWGALILTVVGVYSAKILFNDGHGEEKPPPPANETVDGKVVSPPPGANGSPKEPPRAAA